LPLALKLKFESNARLVFRFTFWFALAFKFVLTLAGLSFCRNQNNPAPQARTNNVPRIVRTTVFAVFGCGGGG